MATPTRRIRNFTRRIPVCPTVESSAEAAEPVSTTQPSASTEDSAPDTASSTPPQPPDPVPNYILPNREPWLTQRAQERMAPTMESSVGPGEDASTTRKPAEPVPNYTLPNREPRNFRRIPQKAPIAKRPVEPVDSTALVKYVGRANIPKMSVWTAHARTGRPIPWEVPLRLPFSIAQRVAWEEYYRRETFRQTQIELQFDEQPKAKSAFWTSRAFKCRSRHSCPSLDVDLDMFKFDRLIKVVVHDQNTVTIFKVSNHSLCYLSGYFRNALSGRWETNNHGKVEIEEDPAVFELFRNYVTTGKLSDVTKFGFLLDYEYNAPLNQKLADREWSVRLDSKAYTEAVPVRHVQLSPFCSVLADPEAIRRFEHISFETVIELYLFADRRDVPRLADLTVSIMLEKISHERKLPIQALEILLDNTGQAESGLMFKMLTEIAAWYVHLADLMGHMDELPIEFALGVVQRQREHAEEKRNRKAKDEKASEDAYMHRLWKNRAFRLYEDPEDLEEQTFKACKWHLHK